MSSVDGQGARCMGMLNQPLVTPGIFIRALLSISSIARVPAPDIRMPIFVVYRQH